MFGEVMNQLVNNKLISSATYDEWESVNSLYPDLVKSGEHIFDESVQLSVRNSNKYKLVTFRLQFTEQLRIESCENTLVNNLPIQVSRCKE